MAKKTRVSFIMGAIVAAATKGLMPALIQNGGSPGMGSNISTRKARHPPRTANHEHAKKAATRG